MNKNLRVIVIVVIALLIIVALAHHLDLGGTFRKFHGG